MQCCAMDVQYIVYQYSIHMYCVKFTLCPRDLVLARKQIASMLESKIFQAYCTILDFYTSIRFQIRLTLSLKALRVKLGDMERFDKEQIGVKEPFLVTKCQFTS